MRRPYKPPTAAPQLAQPEAGGSGWVVALLLLLLTVAVGGAVCVKTGVYRQLMAKQMMGNRPLLPQLIPRHRMR